MDFNRDELEAIIDALTDNIHLLHNYKLNEYRLMSETQASKRINFLNTIRRKLRNELKDKK